MLVINGTVFSSGGIFADGKKICLHLTNPALFELGKQYGDVFVETPTCLKLHLFNGLEWAVYCR